MARNIQKDGSWHYNKAHEKYPVVNGEVWMVGKHGFVCGDLEEQNRLEQTVVQMWGGKRGLMYVDPPWTKSLAAGFRTKAGVEKRSVDLNNLFWQILEPAQQMQTLAVMEGGNGERDRAIDMAESMGAHVGNVWDITYYKKKPCFILVADFRDQRTDDYPDLTGMDDEDTPRAVLQHYSSQYQEQQLVVDPCGGRGLTTRTAEECGWVATTLELSPYRMAEAIDSVVKKIKKDTGETVTPERKS